MSSRNLPYGLMFDHVGDFGELADVEYEGWVAADIRYHLEAARRCVRAAQAIHDEAVGNWRVGWSSP